LPRALALDGKYVRDQLLTLALSEHESGAPVAMTIASKEPKSEQSKTEGELTAAKRLYREMDLSNAIVTGDALHCEAQSMQLIVEQGGDFLLQLKGNQPTALNEAERTIASQSPLLSTQEKIVVHAGKDRGHGRLEQRRIQVYAIEPLSCGLPHVRSLVEVIKTTRSRKTPGAKTTGEGAESTQHLYVSNLQPQSAERFARLIRGHWGGCESRNHWVREAQVAEDATRSKNLNLNGNLAVLRCTVIALKSRRAPAMSWPELFERSSHRPAFAFNLVWNNSLK